MTKSEYHELVDYLGKMFGRIDRRFEAMETRMTRAEVFGESLRDDVRAVAEGVMANTARLDRVETEMREGFARLERRNIIADHRLDLIEAHGRSVDGHLESIELRLSVA